MCYELLMVFKPGDAPAAGKSGTQGSTKETMRIRRQLASVMRGACCAEYITDWLLEMMQGNDPRVTLRDRDPSTNKTRRGRPSSAGSIVQELPTLSESMAAMQILLQRRDGAPARKEDLDREVAAESTSAASLDAARLAAMGPAAIREMVQAMRRATGAVGAAQAIPAVSSGHAATELPASSSELVDVQAGAGASKPVIDV